VIKESTTNKGKGRVWSARISIACVCVHSLPGKGRRQERGGKSIGAMPGTDVLVT
jgi:hypothetical protein